MGTLRVAALLIAGGGALDSLAYIAYGHVFTNAQTGNVVLTAVYAAQGDWAQTLRFDPPMLAFFPGIFTAQWMRHWCFQGDARAASVAILCLEIVILATFGLATCVLPDLPLPDMAVVFALAFTAALQNAGFRHVGKWSYTSVVTTGNLRCLGETFFAGVFPFHKPEALAQARVMAAICASFAAGAVIGAALSVRFGKAAVLFPILLLLLAILFCVGKAYAPPIGGPPSSGSDQAPR